MEALPLRILPDSDLRRRWKKPSRRAAPGRGLLFPVSAACAVPGCRFAGRASRPLWTVTLKS